MRSADVHRALRQESNRFALCQMLAKSTRLLHRQGGPIEQTITLALDGVHQKTIRGDLSQDVEPQTVPEHTVLFAPGSTL